VNSGLGFSSAVTYGSATGMYPTDVQYPSPENRNRLYAVPVVGLLLRAIMLIPHLVVLYVLNIIVGLLQYVLWIPVLFTGRYPDFGHLLVGGTLSWQTRVMAFYLGLSDKYPAFSLADPGGTEEAHMLLQPAPTANRLYAVPVLGFVVKAIMLIPHLIVLYVLYLIAMVVMLVAWIPVLLSGTYPSFATTMVGGTLRWYTRVYAFYFGLTDAYPPFRLSS
jgi:hypothetical protein